MESETEKKLHIKKSKSPNFVSNTKAPIFQCKKTPKFLGFDKLMGQKFKGGDEVGWYQSATREESSCEVVDGGGE